MYRVISRTYTAGRFRVVVPQRPHAVPYTSYLDVDNRWRASILYTRADIARTLRFYRKRSGLVTRTTDASYTA